MISHSLEAFASMLYRLYTHTLFEDFSLSNVSEEHLMGLSVSGCSVFVLGGHCPFRVVIDIIILLLIALLHIPYVFVIPIAISIPVVVLPFTVIHIFVSIGNFVLFLFLFFYSY
jgi:hypothetical protein